MKEKNDKREREKETERGLCPKMGKQKNVEPERRGRWRGVERVET